MRLTTIATTSSLPVRRFEVDNLSDVVVIAGQNGIGKSRLVDSVLAGFRNANNQNVRLVLEATSEEERSTWQKTNLDSANPEDRAKLTATLRRKKTRAKWESSIVQFESDRTMAQPSPYPFNFNVVDPWDEKLSWNVTLGGFKARFQDTVHSLFRKMHSQEKYIAQVVRERQAKGETSLPFFGDPLIDFKEAFSQLVGPKKLLDLDLNDQELYFEHEGNRLPISALSSGEREVVNIVFDFILRSPSDCIVFFDEPELHLHPELSYRLLQTLKSVGLRNQFFFCTHSPDIITASLENTVIFLCPPERLPDGSDKNQAVVVAENDDTNNALRLLGQSIGIVSLGKKIVLIEGTNASLDKQAYGAILKNRFPDLVLAPSGDREVVESFQHLSEVVLSKTIWGVNFFMVCDKDITDKAKIASIETSANGRLRYLKRYHLENYFLDADTWVRVFQDMGTEPEGSWLYDSSKIRQKLLSIAKETIPYAVSLIVSAQVRRDVGNASVMPKGLNKQEVDSVVALFLDRVKEEHQRATDALDSQKVEALVRATYAQLESICSDGSDQWMVLIPGKQILARFASEITIDLGRLKRAYINANNKHSLHAFDDILAIFSEFSAHSA